MRRSTKLQNGNSHSTVNGASTTTTENTKTKTHKTVYVIFISLLLDLLAFTIILPLLPTILERYRLNDSSGFYVSLSAHIGYFQRLVGAPDKYNSVLFGGFLGSMFSFLQFVVSPIMGALSDCYGRKPILLISLVSINSYISWIKLKVFFLFEHHVNRLICTFLTFDRLGFPVRM